MITVSVIAILTAALQASAPAPDVITPSLVIGGYVSDRDYPRAALSAREQGNVTLRYVVTERGRVGECVIEQSSGSAALDQQSCAIWTQRMRFRPARDANGRAVPDAGTRVFAWRINSPCGHVAPGAICITR